MESKDGSKTVTNEIDKKMALKGEETSED